MKRIRETRYLLSSIGFSILFTLYIIPLRLLNPYNTSWVFAGDPGLRDLSGHAIGSMFYSSDQWQHPIGIIGNYGKTVGSTTLFWNSNPLFSLLQKVLHHLGLVPQLFQFIGLELAIGFILTGFSAFLLTKKFGGTDIAALLSSCLTVLSTSLFVHVFNDTLMWHFLIFFSMVLFLGDQKSKLHFWLILAAITLATQAYFLPIILVFFAIATLRSRPWKFSTFAFRSLSMVFLLTFLYYELGGFLISPDKRATSLDSAKQLSCTVECLVDSRNSGIFTFGSPNASWEGWRYIGVSTIILFLVALFFMINHLRTSGFRYNFKNEYIFLTIISLGFFVLSLGPVWRVGHHAFKPPFYSVIDYFFETFRATGRFAIPFVGLLICFGSTQIDKLKYGVFPLRLILCCTLVTAQYLEMSDLYESVAYAAEVGVSTKFIPDKNLTKLFEAKESIQIIEANSGDIDHLPWEQFSYFGLINNYNIDSWNFLARSDQSKAGKQQQVSVSNAVACKFNNQTVYVINKMIYDMIPSDCRARLTEYPGTPTWNYFTFA